VAFEGRTGGMIPTPGEVVEALQRLHAATTARPAGATKEVRP
jgi:hypothetical protein